MTMKSKWQRGETAIGLWCAFGDTGILELAALSDFDYVTVDLQHGLSTWSSLPDVLRILKGKGPTVLVRVPANNFDYIGRALDLGADGVVVPMVDTADEAAAAVRACHYPRRNSAASRNGYRSFGPVYADHDGVRDTDLINDDVICVLQVETQQGLENVGAIAGVPGVDVVYVGPYDLALSTGRGGETYRNNIEIDSDICSVIAAAQKSGIAMGMHCDGPEMAAYWANKGAAMITAALDTAIVRTAYSALVRSTRKEISLKKKSADTPLVATR